MRFLEVIEAAQCCQASKAEAKRRAARDQLTAADRKRADAARKYQNDIQSAKSTAQQAKAKIRSLGVAEATLMPSESAKLIERPDSYALRDHGGRILGRIEAVGELLQAKDQHGAVVGWYDPRQNQTRNKIGTIVGSGDFLSALVVRAAGGGFKLPPAV